MLDIPFIEDDYNHKKLQELFGMKKHFIAYFDILGFAEIVNQENKFMDLKVLHTINDIIKNTKKVIPILRNTENTLKMKVFSDNFLICTENDYIALISLVSCLQSSFISCDLFIRGSLYYGDLVCNDDFVYGKGLIDAYKIESEISIFPRIVIDDTFFKGAHSYVNITCKRELSDDELLESFNEFYCIDFDTNKYINYLGVMDNFIIDKSTKYGFYELLKDHAKNIRVGLQSKNKRKLQKYQWCRKYHNEICKKYQHDDLHIEFPLQEGNHDHEKSYKL